MRPLSKLTALCLSGLLPLTAAAFDMHFLDQAPMRFFTKQDMNLFQTTVDQALDETTSGDSRQWTNDASGSSGIVKVVTEFTEDGLSCRRLAITNRTKQAEARSVVDMCTVDVSWVLRERLVSLPSSSLVTPVGEALLRDYDTARHSDRASRR